MIVTGCLSGQCSCECPVLAGSKNPTLDSVCRLTDLYPMIHTRGTTILALAAPSVQVFIDAVFPYCDLVADQVRLVRFVRGRESSHTPVSVSQQSSGLGIRFTMMFSGRGRFVGVIIGICVGSMIACYTVLQIPMRYINMQSVY